MPTSDALTRDFVDTLRHATVPEHHVSVLAPGHEHVTVWPRGDTHHVPHVSPCLGLHHLARLTICQEDLILASAGRDKRLSSWDPGTVPNGAIVNTQGAGVEITSLQSLIPDILSQPRHVGDLD